MAQECPPTQVPGLIDPADGKAYLQQGPSGGQGGGGTAAIGTTADAAATDSTSAWSAIALLKGIFAKLLAVIAGTLSWTVNWTPLSAVSNILLGAAVAPSIKSLANGAAQISSAIDNSSNRYQWLNLDLLVRGASAFTAGGYVGVWIITSLDGTNYEDASATGPVVPARPPDAYIFLRAVATAQRIECPLIAVPPCKFKVLLQNSGGQAFTNTDGENVLDGYFNS